ncbi:smg5 nonsense mediated mRNA decay factor isoform X2 [Oratosquilla oratoria]|uniref:smg5 nonsense mediated mRNA decay factor isoform X2 n=1 Tax=Oratosquilla oratoria TaxID=337810 RepID=UPI003F75B3EB
MKKSVPITEEKTENLEQLKRLTKYVSEGIRKADATVENAGSVGAVFTSAGIGARSRLRDACERILQLGPSAHTRKFEEVLWRKVYYEPLSVGKRMRKGGSWNPAERHWIVRHLQDGIAYYHHLLHIFASENRMAVNSIDLIPPFERDSRPVATESDAVQEFVQRCLTCLGDLARYMLEVPHTPSYPLAVRYYLQALSPRCDGGGLIHSNLANVYISQQQHILGAVHCFRALTCEKAFEGAEGNLKRLLERSKVVCEQLPEDSRPSCTQEQHQQFVHTILYLVYCITFNKSTQKVAKLCQESLVSLGKILENWDEIEMDTNDRSLAPSPSPQGTPNGLLHTTEERLTPNGHEHLRSSPEKMCALQPCKLTPELLVAICALLILCLHKLNKSGSTHSGMCRALLISMFMTFISHVNERLQQRISLIDPTFLQALLPNSQEDKEKQIEDELEEEKTNKGDGEEENQGGDKKKAKGSKGRQLAKLRRRRRASLEHSDMSEDEDDEAGNHSSSSLEGDKGDSSSGDSSSDEEIDLSQLDLSEDEDDSDEDVKVESDQEWQGLTPEEHLQLIGREGFLPAVYVLGEWLQQDEAALAMCANMLDSLWATVSQLLNLLKLDLDKLTQGWSTNPFRRLARLVQEGASEIVDSAPLPEDLQLAPVLPSPHAHKTVPLPLRTKELVLLRVHRISQFGDTVSGRKDAPLIKDTKTSLFRAAAHTPAMKDIHHTPAGEENNVNTVEDQETESVGRGAGRREKEHQHEERRLAGMQSLTAQWLQHEVKTLEERTARHATLGMYLVPDASALIHHLPAIKALIANPTHMIIIPQTVIALLDQQKRESLGARDAIRWLEVKFRHGSRFIRSQRPHERSHLPLIKYPKRKDKEAWDWFQLVECCHYLSSQVKHNTHVKTSTVTLLTGDHNLHVDKNYSPAGIANAAGAELEHMEEFMRKWQTSTKGHS